MNDMQNSVRVVIALFGIISVFILPWWVGVACIVLLALRYQAWEAIVIGALIDLTWLPSNPTAHALPVFAILAIIIVWGFEPLRAQFLLSQ
jgi:hypothetical protein